VVGLLPRDDAKNQSWLHETWQALMPLLPNRVSVNELHDEGAERVRAAYGSSFTRLAPSNESTIRPIFPLEPKHSAGGLRIRALICYTEGSGKGLISQQIGA
jgi:hypothetical protein